MQLQQSPEVLNLDLAVAEDLVQQAGPDRLARMSRYHRGPPIVVPEEVVTAFDADRDEA